MSEAHPNLSLAAHRWFGMSPEKLTDRQRRVLERALSRKTLSKNTNVVFESDMTFGERLADHVASFGGSWKFIILFGIVLALWTVLNLLLGRQAFDPYPFIFLNLMLSMLAALQAPVIMMSQNRQSAKDRLDAAHDYEVNLKSEIEIMELHDKLEQMRSQELETLVRQQGEQIALLTRLVEQKGGAA